MKTHFAKRSQIVILASARIQILLLEAGSWLLEAVLQNEPKPERCPLHAERYFTKRTQNLWSLDSLLWSIYQTNPNLTGA